MQCMNTNKMYVSNTNTNTSLTLNKIMVLKCKICGLQFEEEKRLQIHKNVHGRKPKISEYGSPEFSQDRLRG
jgi:transcription elongation factor Elf1